MSAADQSPNRYGPLPPKRSRHAVQSVVIFASSPRAPSVWFWPDKLLRKSIGISRRNRKKPACICALTGLAIARAAKSSGQNFTSGANSARVSMITMLSQTMLSPTFRTGTSPLGECLAMAALVSGKSSGTKNSLKCEARMLHGKPCKHRPRKIVPITNN